MQKIGFTKKAVSPAMALITARYLIRQTKKRFNVKIISRFAILTALFICCFSTTASAMADGYKLKGTPWYKADKTLGGCDRGGSGCVMDVGNHPCGVGPAPNGGSVNADLSTEIMLATDLYQANATNLDMPVGYQDIQFIVYSKTGRDIDSDFSAYYPDIPSLDVADAKAVQGTIRWGTGPGRGVIQGCDVGGSGCTITLNGAALSVAPSYGSADVVSAADSATEITIGTDLYQAAATGTGMPSGYQAVYSIIYSKTGRDITDDFMTLFPDVPILPPTH